MSLVTLVIRWTIISRELKLLLDINVYGNKNNQGIMLLYLMHKIPRKITIQVGVLSFESLFFKFLLV